LGINGTGFLQATNQQHQSIEGNHVVPHSKTFKINQLFNNRKHLL